MGLREILQKFTAKREKLKELQENRKVQQIAVEREKNSNERELERFMEERRQANIKKQLEEFRKQKTEEMWKSNMFKDDGHRILDAGNPILQQKKLFGLKSNMLNCSNGFFK